MRNCTVWVCTNTGISTIDGYFFCYEMEQSNNIDLIDTNATSVFVSGQGHYHVLSLHRYVKTTMLDHLFTPLTCNLQAQWPITLMNVHSKL